MNMWQLQFFVDFVMKVKWMDKVVYVVGVVVWWLVDGKLWILLIYCMKYCDIIFFKGKVDFGEMFVEMVVCEVYEEIGI